MGSRLGRGPVDLARGGAGGQRPAHRGGQARVARVFPVRVPVRNVLELEAQPHDLARCDPAGACATSSARTCSVCTTLPAAAAPSGSAERNTAARPFQVFVIGECDSSRGRNSRVTAASASKSLRFRALIRSTSAMNRGSSCSASKVGSSSRNPDIGRSIDERALQPWKRFVALSKAGVNGGDVERRHVLLLLELQRTLQFRARLVEPGPASPMPVPRCRNCPACARRARAVAGIPPARAHAVRNVDRHARERCGRCRRDRRTPASRRAPRSPPDTARIEKNIAGGRARRDPQRFELPGALEIRQRARGGAVHSVRDAAPVISARVGRIQRDGAIVFGHAHLPVELVLDRDVTQRGMRGGELGLYLERALRRHARARVGIMRPHDSEHGQRRVTVRDAHMRQRITRIEREGFLEFHDRLLEALLGEPAPREPAVRVREIGRRVLGGTALTAARQVTSKRCTQRLADSFRDGVLHFENGREVLIEAAGPDLAAVFHVEQTRGDAQSAVAMLQRAVEHDLGVQRQACRERILVRRGVTTHGAQGLDDGTIEFAEPGDQRFGHAELEGFIALREHQRFEGQHGERLRADGDRGCRRRQIATRSQAPITRPPAPSTHGRQHGRTGAAFSAPLRQAVQPVVRWRR